METSSSSLIIIEMIEESRIDDSTVGRLHAIIFFNKTCSVLVYVYVCTSYNAAYIHVQYELYRMQL